jgi:hypothetical protein
VATLAACSLEPALENSPDRLIEDLNTLSVARRARRHLNEASRAPRQILKQGGVWMTPLIRRIAALALVFGLLLVAVSGCRGSGRKEDSDTVPAVGSNESERPVAPDYRSGESAGSDSGSSGANESTGSDYGSDESTAPDSSTDPCAFPDDPLCSRNPIKVPPPDISNWP